MSNENNRNAFIGENIETLFKNSIQNYQNANVIDKIKAKYKICGDLENSSKSGIYRNKADVRISFTCGHYVEANIKSYKAGFNQLTRTSVSKFCERFSLSSEDKKELEDIVVRKSRNTKDALFTQEEQSKWGDFFTKNIQNILKWGFSDYPSREILVLHDRTASMFRIYSMKDVLAKLSKENIIFTKGGFNIGQCVSFQRKGGNGSLSKSIPKTNINHPGNDIQLKLKLFITVKFLEDIKIAEYKA